MPIIRYFRNCTIKYTQSERSGPGEFKYYQVKKQGCYVITDSSIKSVKIHAFEDGLKPKLKRSKSLKIEGGEEVSEETYLKELNDWKTLINQNK